MNTLKRAVAYVRVSTDKQAVHGASLEVQSVKIAAMIELQDAKLLETIEDAESGKNLDRPGLQRIMTMARKREIDMVIVYKLDRLTRSVVDLAELVHVFAKFDVSLISLSEHLDTGTAGGRMVMNMLTVISQWERETIGERTAVVMRHKKATRKVFNHSPYGYNRVDSDLVVNHDEMAVAHSILQWHATLSLRRIASRLNNKGIAAKRGGKWYVSSVANVVSNRQLYEGAQ
jgi:DNA invertase Pin-like site-specific DNA recombinase